MAISLKKITTFQNEGDVPYLVTVNSYKELQHYLATRPHFKILGKGSNTVISPNITYDLLKISPSFLLDPDTPIHQCQGTRLTVSAGVSVHQLMKIMMDYKLTGLEFMAGVPASVGGMVTMNFGCWGHEIAQFIHTINVVHPDGRCETLHRDQLQFNYRHSLIQITDLIIVSATFELMPGDLTLTKMAISQNIKKRLSSQPLHEKTFGSVFTNPPNQSAGQLIESLNLKGHVHGQIKISEQHANFFVNLGNATFQQLQELIKDVQNRVANAYGVNLEPEVKRFV